MEPTFSETDNEVIVESSRLSWRKKALLITSVVLVLILTIVFFTQRDEAPVNKTESNFEDALQLSNTRQDQSDLQNFFVEKVKDGVNDQETRSAINWIAHRYFDNGGNIYEIFDFINSHPELSFLKEAEEIYPDIFARIYRDESPKVFSFDSLYALLAYYETIDKYGYGDIAIWGIAANKYAEMAVWSIPEDEAEMNEEYLEYYNLMVSKSIYFGNKVRNYIYENAKETATLEDLRNIEGVIPDDLLVSLNQYASSIAYLQGVGAPVKADFSTIEFFEFTSKYAEEKVPRLYLFTNYLYAVSLVNTNVSNEQEVSVPLDRFVSYVSDINNYGAGTVKRVIQSKDNSELGMFDYKMTLVLAEAHPGFKNWLSERGWSESDFNFSLLR